MSNTPNLSPAERLGIILTSLIQAILARAGWFLPAGLIAKIEDNVRGISEAFAFLATQLQAAAEQAAQPVQMANGRRSSAHPARKARHAGAATRSPRPQVADNPTPLPDAGSRELAPHWRESPRSCVTFAHWPRVRPKPKTAWAKPAPWHVHNVALS